MSKANINSCLLPLGSYPTEGSCAPFNTTLFLVPFTISNVAAFMVQYYLGTQSQRDKWRIFDKPILTTVPPQTPYLEDLRIQYYPRLKNVNPPLPNLLTACWDPTSATICSIFSVAAAIISAALLRHGANNKIDIGITTLLWLSRPRGNWLTIFLSHNHNRLTDNHSLVETALDLLCQDCLLSLLAIPFAVMVVGIVGTDASDAIECVEEILGATQPQLGFKLYWGGAAGILITGALGAMWLGYIVWKLLHQGRQDFLSKRQSLVASALCAAGSTAGYIFWTGLMKLPMQNVFCANGGILTGLTLINALVPCLNAIVRSWVGYPFNGTRA